MVSDIDTLLSHPKKLLIDHIGGVVENTKKLTKSKIAELIAIFHDLGKLNPNFQAKLDINREGKGYANHSYLSAYAFFCAFSSSKPNLDSLKKFLEIDFFTKNDLIIIAVLIAKHHGNLPDFSPEDYNGTGVSILSKKENFALYQFLDQNKNLPIVKFLNHFIKTDDFLKYMTMPKVQHFFSETLFLQEEKDNKNVLNFFLNYQSAFANVILADKIDAAEFNDFLDQKSNDIGVFSKDFTFKLNSYLKQLEQNSELNQLRTKLRKNAVENIKKGLKNDERIYELTAPTGSGKTLMLLSLASEIIKTKGYKRIIYGLPFLSITEQVEAEVLKIFEGCEDYIQRIDSKSENDRFEEIQKALDNEPTEKNISEANILQFQEDTFTYPFIITTFVRFFETLLSNRNSELLKLPNFSKSIFLLDEIQALPPRLYGFFIAYLKKFCEKFDSYVIISTATQPNFELPKDDVKVSDFFFDYIKPTPLLSLNYFNDDLFNRYKIEFNKEPIDLEKLNSLVLSEDTSILLILNTIDDTKELYELLKNKVDEKILLLLNTHFTPNDRKKKIAIAKERLEQGERVILISTQLIEAGVDIDFPVVYRDFATVSSIVQSAGRCNRNGKFKLGKVKLFKLQNKGKIRSELIYQGKDKEMLRFTKESLNETKYEEKEILNVQQNFFNQIQSELNFAKHSQNSPKLEFDFLKDIKECQFNKLGKFQLIDEQVFGKEYKFFVAKNRQDNRFEVLLEMQDELTELFKNSTDKSLIRVKKRSIKTHLKNMANQIVQVRLRKNHTIPFLANSRDYFALFKIERDSYSFETGINLDASTDIL